MTIDPEDPLAAAVTEAIQGGDLDRLRRLLAEHSGPATARLGDDRPGGMTRTLLHVATDWPGHFPTARPPLPSWSRPGPTWTPASAAAATTRPRGTGRPAATTSRSWTPLLDLGADIEAPGAVIAGGPPLTDARAFGQWRAAHRLGAKPFAELVDTRR